ncbi:MAG: hypothetical protein L6R42_007329, partial [Xanthoria sp. 1 TBL-2021]
ESYGRELKSIATGCEDVLTQLDKILVKYNALSEQERSARRLWKKIRFGNGAVADVAELRSRVTYYTSALSLFLNLVSVGTVGAAEKKMDQAGGDLRDIKSAVNYITAHFLAAERREGSVLTAYTNDDRDAWRELRRGLVKAGFRDSFVRKHMNTIMAYVKELDDKGVLDDIVTDEAGSPTDLAHGSNDSEGSLGADQKAGSSFTTRSSAARKAPVIEDGDHEERPPESGENFQLSQPSEPNSCMKIPETLETDPGLLYNDRPSPDLSKRSGSSTFVAQDSQSAMVDGQTLKPNSQPCEHNIQGSRQYKEADFLKPENLRYYISTVPGPSSKSGMIFLDDMALPAFIADHSIIYTNSAPTRFTDPCRLCSLLLSFRLRVMSLMDPNGLFKPEDHDLWIEAVDLLLYPVISNDDSYVDESLYVYFDIRQITTLCSIATSATLKKSVISSTPPGDMDSDKKGKGTKTPRRGTLSLTPQSHTHREPLYGRQKRYWLKKMLTGPR